MNPKISAPAVIRKYANRRLYNTANGQFVTLADLQAMVRRGEEFVVREAKTDRDITVSVLAQIVAEEAAKGNNLLSSDYLRRLLLYYHEGLGEHLSAYLERSMDVLRRESARPPPPPVEPLRSGRGRSRRSASSVNATRSTSRACSLRGSTIASADMDDRTEREAAESAQAPAAAERDDIPALRAQLLAIQRRLDDIERERE